MIKMGKVIQGELTGSVLKIRGVINCFYFLENLSFCLVHVHVYDTRCQQNLESRNPDNIDKEAFFKVLVISKDITLMGRFLN